MSIAIAIGVLLPSHILGEHCEIIGQPIIHNGKVYHYQSEVDDDYELPEGEGLYNGKFIINDDQYPDILTDPSILLQE